MLDKKQKIEKARELFYKNNFNKKITDGYLSENWINGYLYDDLEEKIKDWVAREKNLPEDDIHRVTHEFGANSFFMWLTTD